MKKQFLPLDNACILRQRYVTDSIHAKLPPVNGKSGTRTFANLSPDPRPLAEATDGY
jgi:hypothetical protein